MANKNTNILKTVEQFGKQLFNFIRTKVQTNEDAEDVMQDVWYQLSGIEVFETIESMSGWLFRVAKNKITDRFRKKSTESLENFSFINDDGELFFKDILLANNQTPEVEYLKNIFWDELFNALDELPEKQRIVFIKNELESISLQQIADESGENLKTIISRKGYAIKHLRKRLNILYNDYFYN